MSYTAPKHDIMLLTSHHIQSHHMTSLIGRKEDVFVVSVQKRCVQFRFIDQVDQLINLHIFKTKLQISEYSGIWCPLTFSVSDEQTGLRICPRIGICAGFSLKTCSTEERDGELTRATPDLRTLHRPNLTNSQYFSWLDVSGMRCMNNVND